MCIKVYDSVTPVLILIKVEHSNSLPSQVHKALVLLVNYLTNAIWLVFGGRAFPTCEQVKLLLLPKSRIERLGGPPNKISGSESFTRWLVRLASERASVRASESELASERAKI